MTDSHVKKRSPGNLVFRNPNLVQDILERASIKLMDNLELRRINKVFNEEFLRNFRKTHRNMEIVDVHETGVDYDVLSRHTVIVNTRKLSLSMASKHLRFLFETMGVQLEKFEFVGFPRLPFGNVQREIHGIIVNQVLRNQSLKSLVGMYDVCESGCVECRRRGFGCEEYGPLQLTDLTTPLRENLHFRNLIVTDRLLAEIGQRSTDTAQSKAECLATMSTFISCNITCDQLTFRIATLTRYPLEVINEMCTVWKPKSIRIHLQHLRYVFDDDVEDEYTWPMYFTIFRFQNAPARTPIGQKVFENVEILVDRAWLSDEMLCEDGEGMENVVPNARRVFPTSRLSVRMCYKETLVFNRNQLNGIINTCWKDNSNEDLQITFRLFSGWRDSTEFDVPESFTSIGKHVTTTLLPSTIHWNSLVEHRLCHCTGRTFRMTDRKSKCVIDLEVMIRNSDIEKVLEKNYGKISTGYIQHYVPTFCELTDLETLRNRLAEQRHYGQVDVAQRLLNDIASFCVYGAVSREHCMTMMRCLITPRITCDTLCLKVNEFLYINWGVKYPIEVLPREVVEEMCRVWRVHSVIVRFEYFPPQHTLPETWSARRWFTEFRLNAPSGRQPETVGLRFGRVRIDVRKTAVACFEVLSDYSVTANAQCAHIPDTPHYNNLVANARKLFPTDRILVDGKEELNKCEFGQFNEILFHDILSTALKEYDGQEGLEVTFRHFPNVSPTADTSYEPPESFEYEGRHFSTTVAPETRRHTVMFIITDTSANFTLNMELRVKPDLFIASDWFPERRFQRGFMRHLQRR